MGERKFSQFLSKLPALALKKLWARGSQRVSRLNRATPLLRRLPQLLSTDLFLKAFTFENELWGFLPCRCNWLEQIGYINSKSTVLWHCLCYHSASFLVISLTLFTFAYKPLTLQALPSAVSSSPHMCSCLTAGKRRSTFHPFCQSEFAAKLAPATAIHRVSSLHSPHS